MNDHVQASACLTGKTMSSLALEASRELLAKDRRIKELEAQVEDLQRQLALAEIALGRRS